jgi:hypothetical protein
MGTQVLGPESISDSLRFLQTYEPEIIQGLEPFGFSKDLVDTLISEVIADPPSLPDSTLVDALRMEANAFDATIPFWSSGRNIKGHDRSHARRSPPPR